MIPVKQMDSSRRRRAMQSCAATYQTSPSLPSNKVGLICKFRHRDFQINDRGKKKSVCAHRFLFSLAALKETCDWFVDNYDTARK